MVKTPVITNPSSTLTLCFGSFGTCGVPKARLCIQTPESDEFPILRNNNNNNNYYYYYYHTALEGVGIYPL